MKEFEYFITGLFIGVIFTTVVTVVYFLGEPEVIKTSKKITPEWRLITDGKKVDTLYIYKIK